MLIVFYNISITLKQFSSEIDLGADNFSEFIVFLITPEFAIRIEFKLLKLLLLIDYFIECLSHDFPLLYLIFLGKLSS